MSSSLSRSLKTEALLSDVASLYRKQRSKTCDMCCKIQTAETVVAGCGSFSPLWADTWTLCVRPAPGSDLAEQEWTTQVTSLHAECGRHECLVPFESIWERLHVTNTLTVFLPLTVSSVFNVSSEDLHDLIVSCQMYKKVSIRSQESFLDQHDSFISANQRICCNSVMLKFVFSVLRGVTLVLQSGQLRCAIHRFSC